MPSPDRSARAPRVGPGRPPWAAGALALVLAAGGGWLVLHGSADRAGPPLPPPAPSSATPAPSPSPTPVLQPAFPPLGASAPTRIRIPAIKVDAPVTGLGLTAAHQVATPPMDQRNLAGWYRDGASPGAAGTAIVVGHADNRSGPAVFYRLGLLRPGDTVEVARKDRRTAVFTIDSVRVFPKKDFPDAMVYGGIADRAELRVITCGGRFDRGTGYEANTVVFAHLSSVRG
ncbi:class F sortase [Streptomyces sp. NRRL WC-3742]|uniref:class F sortase n=1 Tax=Streptomyces sp. NRRL WC-3742 TaxID=1463934 RepID=UPI000565CA87|nr:class F sortase [Streptomyces sp. NRRL WC-3742]